MELLPERTLLHAVWTWKRSAKTHMPVRERHSWRSQVAIVDGHPIPITLGLCPKPQGLSLFTSRAPLTVSFTGNHHLSGEKWLSIVTLPGFASFHDRELCLWWPFQMAVCIVNKSFEADNVSIAGVSAKVTSNKRTKDFYHIFGFHCYIAETMVKANMKWYAFYLIRWGFHTLVCQIMTGRAMDSSIKKVPNNALLW